MNIKDCKGCKLMQCAQHYYKTAHICSLLYTDSDLYIKVPVCPCSICLIKGICEDACQAYFRYSSLIQPTIYSIYNDKYNDRNLLTIGSDYRDNMEEHNTNEDI